MRNSRYTFDTDLNAIKVLRGIFGIVLHIGGFFFTLLLFMRIHSPESSVLLFCEQGDIKITVNLQTKGH